MRLLITSLVAVAGFAGAASADFLTVPANQHLYTSHDAGMVASPLTGDSTRAGGAPQYSSIAAPATGYQALADGTFAQRDDYTSIAAGNFNLDLFKFVGGVTAVGGILDFFFLDNATPTPNVVASFAIQFPQAGHFIWSITFGAADPVILNAGQLQIQSRTGSSGAWWFTSTPAAPGNNSFTSGSGSQFTPPLIQTFEMQVPGPGSLALLGLGGLVGLRRRR